MLQIDPELVAGTLVGGRYRIGRELGSGAFGHVYAAEQEVFEVPFRAVALKLFTKGYVTWRNAAKVFQEATSLELLASQARSRGEQPHLVAVYDLGVFEDLGHTPFVAMELVAGGSLEGELKRAGRLPLSTVLRHTREVCAGLALAHEANIVHRDVKPANVLLSRGEAGTFVKLSDFGIAVDRYKLFLKPDEGHENLAVAPPESRHGVPPSPAYDVYSLGLLILELLSGENPVEAAMQRARQAGRPREEILHRAYERLDQFQDPATGVPITELLPELGSHRRLRRIVKRCLALDPGQRYLNASEVGDELAGPAASGGSA